MGELTKVQVSALEECRRHNDRGMLYWFRERSMASLATMGLVEKWLPKSVADRPRMKGRPWRITEAGRQALRSTSSPGGENAG